MIEWGREFVRAKTKPPQLELERGDNVISTYFRRNGQIDRLRKKERYVTQYSNLTRKKSISIKLFMFK